MAGIGGSIKRQGFVIGSYVSVVKVGSLLSFVFGGMVVHYLSVRALMLLVGMLILTGMLVSASLIRGKAGTKDEM